MAFRNSLTASSSLPWSARSIPRAFWRSERAIRSLSRIRSGRGVRIEADGRQVAGEGLAVELFFRQDRPEVVVGVGGLRIQLDGLSELLDRLVEHAVVRELDPAGVVAVRKGDPILVPHPFGSSILVEKDRISKVWF